MILNNGGLRSLVAAGLILRDESHLRVTLLHIQDGRPSAALRCEWVHQQAEHLGIAKVVTLEMVHLHAHAWSDGAEGHAAGSFTAGPLLLAALDTARQMQAQRVVWPGSFNGKVPAIAQATEQMMLAQQFAELESEAVPRLEGPLVELRDRQLVELGDSMGLSWELAWSCVGPGGHPCGTCIGCQRRQKAFEAAALVDAQA